MRVEAYDTTYHQFVEGDAGEQTAPQETTVPGLTQIGPGLFVSLRDVTLIRYVPETGGSAESE